MVAASDRLFFVEEPDGSARVRLDESPADRDHRSRAAAVGPDELGRANGLQPRLLGIDEGLVFA